MKSFLGILFCAVLATMSPLRAAELEGASVTLSYSAFTQDTDFDHLGLEGSLALRFSPQILAQVDLGRDTFGVSDLQASGFGLHGIYRVNPSTDIGLFYTYEQAKRNTVSADVDLYGLEVGHRMGATAFEGYLAHGTSDAGDGALWGLITTYSFGAQTELSGRYEHIDVQGLEGGKLALRLNRDLTPQTEVFVEIGSAKARAFGVSDSEPYVGLGGRISFGPNAVPFERRGLARVLPGL